MRHIHEETGSARIAQANERGICDYCDDGTNAIARAIELIGPEQVAALRQADLLIMDAQELQTQQKRVNEMLLETQRQLRGLLADLTYRDQPEDEV